MSPPDVYFQQLKTEHNRTTRAKNTSCEWNEFKAEENWIHPNVSTDWQHHVKYLTFASPNVQRLLCFIDIMIISKQGILCWCANIRGIEVSQTQGAQSINGTISTYRSMVTEPYSKFIKLNEQKRFKCNTREYFHRFKKVSSEMAFTSGSVTFLIPNFLIVELTLLSVIQRTRCGLQRWKINRKKTAIACEYGKGDSKSRQISKLFPFFVWEKINTKWDCAMVSALFCTVWISTSL